MVSQPRQPGVRLVAAVVWLLAAVCSAEVTPAPHAEPAKIPNPAVRKCLDDGYEPQAVLGPDGLPIDHNCVDKSSGKACEVWKYLRGDCRLPDAPPR